MPITAIFLTLAETAVALGLPPKEVTMMRRSDPHFPMGIKLGYRYCLPQQAVRQYKERLRRQSSRKTPSQTAMNSRIAMPDVATMLGIDYKALERRFLNKGFADHFRRTKIRGRWWFERQDVENYLDLRDAVPKSMVDRKAGAALIGMGQPRFDQLQRSDAQFPAPTFLHGKRYWHPEQLVLYAGEISRFVKMATVHEVAQQLDIPRVELYRLIREGAVPEPTRRFGEMRWERHQLKGLLATLKTRHKEKQQAARS